MKTSKKVLAIVLSVALVLALSVTAFAVTITRDPAAATGNGSIKVTLPTADEGYTAENTYKIYKVFDATLSADGTSVVYTLVDGKTEPPAGFELNAAGNVVYSGGESATGLSAADIAALKAYVADLTPIATVTTTTSDTEFTVDNLPYGYYYIDTTTGSAVSVDNITPDVEVNDKNEYPPVDKTITGASYVDADGKRAMAQVGTSVTYQASITKEAGAENYEFHDNMDAGLSYNNDMIVKVGGLVVAPGANTFSIDLDGDDTVKVTFDNDYIASLADDTVITFTYSATVTSDALQLDPAKNTAHLTYGHEPGSNSTPIKETKVYNARIEVLKTDDEDKPLAGAEFVLKNSEGKYYSISNNVVSWVDSIDAATKRVSGADGKMDPFTGLADGTYTLVETKAPDGYNKSDDTPITINGGDYTADNLIKNATVINKPGKALPSTGGIGTTIFYVIGSMLLLAAAIVLIARRRMAADAM